MSQLHPWVLPVDFQFTTGRVARLIRLDPINFLKTEDGSLPSPISGILVAAADPSAANPDELNKRMTPDELIKFWEIIDRLVVASFYEPKLGNGEGELPLYYVTPAEKMQTFRFQVGLEAASLSRFPERTEVPGVYTVQDGGEVRTASIYDTGSTE